MSNWHAAFRKITHAALISAVACGGAMMSSRTAEANAKPLIGDISQHEITLHTAFHGTELILFGARNAPGDIVVAVRGPDRTATVRRKEKYYGIWMNREQEVYSPVPGFYKLASSRPYEKLAKSLYFDALGVGYKSAIGLPEVQTEQQSVMMQQPASGALASREEVFGNALIRQFRDQGLYSQGAGRVEFIGGTLFKISVPFPDNMPRGTYTAEIYLFSDGELVGSHVTPINVYKIGFDAFAYELAHQRPAVYGVLCVLVAVFGGWLASAIFRRS